MDISRFKYSDLLERYVAVCNKALSENAQRFPFKQILEAAEKTVHGRLTRVDIQEAEEDEKYLITLENGQIVGRPCLEYPACRCQNCWSVSQAYLKSVVDNSTEYIKNPALINWDWLYECQGCGAP